MWAAARLAAPVALACLLAACSSHIGSGGTSGDNNEPWYDKTMVELASGSPSSSSDYAASAPTYAVARTTEPLRTPAALPAASPLAGDDLYRADGSCGGMLLGPGAQGRLGGTAAPLAGAGLSLDMSECDLVRRVGLPDKVEMSTSERGERTLILTYVAGPRPGIYRFLAGRLVAVERAREPAPAAPYATGSRRRG